MSQTSNGIALTELLEKEYQLTSQLTEILNAEQRCLAENNIIELASITEQKTPLLKALEGIAPQRQTLLTEQTKSPTITQLLERNAAALKKCRDLNEVNGTVIAVSLHNTKKIVDILHGTNTNATTYDNQGKTTQTRGTQGHIEI